MKKYIIAILLVLVICPAVNAFDGEVYFEKTSDSVRSPYPVGTIVLDRIHYYKSSGGYRLLPVWCISGIEIGHNMNGFRPYIKVEAMFDYVNDGGRPESIVYDLGFRVDFGKMFIKVSQVNWQTVVDHVGPKQTYTSIRVGFKWGAK